MTAFNIPELRVVQSAKYSGCLYCEACQATFPNESRTWAYASRRVNDSSGNVSYWGHQKLPAGECPFCGRRMEDDR